jgi:hypothetical protein
MAVCNRPRGVASERRHLWNVGQRQDQCRFSYSSAARGQANPVPILGLEENGPPPSSDLWQEAQDLHARYELVSSFPFNPFIVPPGLEPRLYVNHVVDIMAEAYTLGDGSRSILQRAIASCYERGDTAPRVLQVLGEVEKIPAKERVRGWKISAIRAVENLAFSGLTGSDAASQHEFTKTLLDQCTVVELDALDQGSKKFLIPIMCLWLYYVQLSSPTREKLRLVIFIEEAHHVLYRHEQRAKEPALYQLLRQCREKQGIATLART